MAGKKAGKKKKRARVPPEEHPLRKLIPQLKEAERKARAKFQSVSGYEISRSRGEEETFGDLVDELGKLEEEVVGVLSALDRSEVGDLVTPIISLLDAGSAGFFAGSRGRAVGVRVMTAARQALCRNVPEDDDEDDNESQQSTARSQKSAATQGDEESQNGQRTAEQQMHTVGALVSAYAELGQIVLCTQLWRPARDGDHEALSKLLQLNPWTVDEPGREGQGFTNALQVACAGGHAECVELLLKHGAIFRNSDWQKSPRPFVCTAMLTGAGYYDGGGGAPTGILYFQSSSLPRRRIPRETYVYIMDLLLEQATFCEGQNDRTLIENTRLAMLNVEPPAMPEGVAQLPPFKSPKLAAAADKVGSKTPRDGVGRSTPRYMGDGVAGATPRLGRGVTPPSKVGSATPRSGGLGRATPREGVCSQTPREGVGRSTPRNVSDAVAGATPRLGRGVTPPGKVSGATPRTVRNGVGRATPRESVARATPRERNGGSHGAVRERIGKAATCPPPGKERASHASAADKVEGE